MISTDDIGYLVLGRYRIVRRIAVGGMGDIFLARNEGAAGFVRPVVVKQIRREFMRDASMVKMFEREARINARLMHPNIVPVVDFQEERGTYYMVLEYVHGLSLTKWLTFHRLASRPMSPALVVHVADQVARALDAAHGVVSPDGTPTPIIHRDVSPANILISMDGRVRLTDFGISRMRSDPDEYQTQTQAIKGKISYLAPELLRGGEAGPRSDFYALGVVMHECLRGKNEFRTGDSAGTLAKILGEKLTRLDDFRDDVGKELADFVERATAKSSRHRFEGAATFLNALSKVQALSTGQAEEMAKKALHADLTSPVMAEVLRENAPDILDRAWRNLEVPGVTLEDVVLSTSDLLKEQTSGRLVGPSPNPPALPVRKRTLALFFAPMLAATLGLGVWIGRDDGPSSDSDGSSSTVAAAGPTSDAVAVATPATTSRPAVDGGTTRPILAPGSRDAAASLTATSLPPTVQDAGPPDAVGSAVAAPPPAKTRARPRRRVERPAAPPSEEQLKRAFSTRMKRMHACFDGLPQQDRPDGKLEFVFEIEPRVDALAGLTDHLEEVGLDAVLAIIYGLQQNLVYKYMEWIYPKQL